MIDWHWGNHWDNRKFVQVAVKQIWKIGLKGPLSQNEKSIKYNSVEHILHLMFMFQIQVLSV